MSNKLRFAAIVMCAVIALSVVGLVACNGNNPDTSDNPDKPKPTPIGTSLKVYSDKISSVYDVAMLTGPSGKTNTHADWGIGGTDLGFPYYDATNNKMMFLFGDTFSSVNSGSAGWRSNVLGMTSDFDASDGITFDSFVCNMPGMAKQIVDSVHDTSNEGEYTSIPTGGIELNGTHYVFYMAIKDWQNNT